MSNAASISSSTHFRPLQPASVFATVIPPSTGEKTFMGKGTTELSIEVMYSWARKHKDQAAKLATRLQGATLEQTVRSIKSFLYNNFQYLADSRGQKIHSLASAWANRETGIDCKSYSTIASSILLNLGIKHYLRKIKQANNGSRYPGFENTWSHVYVIVPKDQKSGKISGKNSYWVVDGVLQDSQEPPFLAKSDHLMLPHYGLNGPSCRTTPPTKKGVSSTYQVAPVQPQVQTEVLVPPSAKPVVVGQSTKTGSKGPFEVILVTNLDGTNKVYEIEATSKNIEILQGLGCPCESQGLGEPITIATITAIAGLVSSSDSIIASLGSIFQPSAAEEKRYQDLLNAVINGPVADGGNWPVQAANMRGYGIQQLSSWPNDLFPIAAGHLKWAIDGAKAKGQTRVAERYLRVFNELGRMMQAEIQKRNNPVSAGGGFNPQLPNRPIDGQPQSPTQAGFGGMSSSQTSTIIGWAAGLAIAGFVIKTVVDNKKPKGKLAGPAPVKTKV